MFRFTKILFNVNKLTIHLDFAVPSAVPLVRIKSDSTKKFSVMCICLLPSEVSLQLRILPRNIYQNKCRGDEIDAIFNSSCLFTSNALIQFKSLMLVYEEYFSAGVSIYISRITIFTFATVTKKKLLSK